MKKCKNCGKIILKDQNFCTQCGQPLDGNIKKATSIKIRKAQYKCIHCNAVHDTFSCICPDCGLEQVGPITSKSVMALKFNLADKEVKSKTNLFGRKKKNTHTKEQLNRESEKTAILSEYEIPSDKKELLDLIVYLSSQIDIGVLMSESERDLGLGKTEFYRQRLLATSFHDKFKEAYQNAERLFGQDSDFVVIKKLYDEVENRISRVAASKVRQRKKKNKTTSLNGVVAIAAVMVVVGVVGGYLEENARVDDTKYVIADQIESTSSQDINEVETQNPTPVVEEDSNQGSNQDELATIKENVINKSIVEGRDYLVREGIVVTYLDKSSHEDLNRFVFDQKDEDLKNAGWIIDSVDSFDPSSRTLICFVNCKDSKPIDIASQKEEISNEVLTTVVYTFTDMDTEKYAKSKANVRDIPEQNGYKLGSLTQNEKVRVTGKCNETGWFRIEYDNSIGYVSDGLLIDEMVETQVAVAPVENTQTVNPQPVDSTVNTQSVLSNNEKSDDIQESNTNSAPAGVTYVLNINPDSMKFHKPSCGDVKKMSAKNRMDVSWSREEVIKAGYQPCKHCHP